MFRRFALAALVVGMIAPAALAADDSGPSTDATRAAIVKAIPLLEKGSAGSADQRTCFTCHNQATSVLALVEAEKRGFSVDRKNLDRQLQHTAEHLQRGRASYVAGVGQGGQALTAGYALWTLEAGRWPADDTTAAVTGFLAEYQKEEGRWTHPGHRPPSSGSEFTTTYVALRGLAAFGTEAQRPAIDVRTKAAGEWLLSTKPADTEDRVFRLLSLLHIGAAEHEIQKSVDELIAHQRDDGGWAQTSDMQSDAYATATVLVALSRAGKPPRTSPVFGRGLHYLVDTQRDDGSWHVVTRAVPFQPYFESGFPHGPDQFISIAASGWAIQALLLSLPEPQ